MAKFLKSLLVSCVFLSASMAHAISKNAKTGVGIILGAPTAITGRYLLSDKNAVAGGIGFYWHASIFYADYQFLFPGVIKSESSEVNTIVPYIGIGASLSYFNRDYIDRRYNRWENSFTVLGARVPFGLSWMIPKNPVEIFVELVPTIDVIPGLYLEGEGGIGVRVYF